jgi:general secretion pathway protein J
MTLGRPDSSQKEGEAGFSLVETMVALVIFSIISLIGLQVLRSYSDGQVALQNADGQLSQLQVSASIIRDDLAQAVIRPVRTERGDSASYFEGGQAAGIFGAENQPLLRFVRSGYMAARFNPEFPTIQTVEYWYQDGQLVRRAYARPDITSETPYFEQVLVSDITELSVRFRVQDLWVDVVETTLGVRQSLPETLELTMNFDARGTLTRLFAIGVRE